MRDFREQNYYELLDVHPHSSQEELESSYQRARRFFSPDSVATYALFQPDELNLLRRRIEEAFRTLSDPVRRRAYDKEMARLEGDWIQVAALEEEPKREPIEGRPAVQPATDDGSEEDLESDSESGQEKSGSSGADESAEDSEPASESDSPISESEAPKTQDEGDALAGETAPEPEQDDARLSAEAETGDEAEGEDEAEDGAELETEDSDSSGPSEAESDPVSEPEPESPQKTLFSEKGEQPSQADEAEEDEASQLAENSEPDDAPESQEEEGLEASEDSDGLTESEPESPQTEETPASETAPAAEDSEAEVSQGQLPPAPDVAEDTEITGEILMQARQAKGLSLDDLVQTTKISIYYLRNIEKEDYSDLPATVYTRGYLRQLAKIYGLDAQQVSESYLSRMKNKKAEGDS